MAGRLDNKVALITGGGSGIGRTTALLFAHEGAKLAIADVNIEGGEETVGMIEEAGGKALFIRMNVSQTGDVQTMVNKVIETYGRLDCAFNNAGISAPPGTTAADYSEDLWDRIISVNLTGVWLCMKYEIQQMLKQGRGAIVNTASAAGLVGITDPAYCASKHGVVGLTKSAALSFSQAGIRINAVCPGYITTPMVERFTSVDTELEPQLIAQHPIGRLGTPQEVAEAVVWLCSDAASFVTGHALVVDGGYIAQ